MTQPQQPDPWGNWQGQPQPAQAPAPQQIPVYRPPAQPAAAPTQYGQPAAPPPYRPPVQPQQPQYRPPTQAPAPQQPVAPPPYGQPSQGWGQPQQYPGQQQPVQQRPAQPPVAPPQQTYGQPQRPAQPPKAPTERRGIRPIVSGTLSVPKIAALTAALVLLLVGIFVGHSVGGAKTTRLDSTKVASGVTGVLENNYGIPNVLNTQCPDNMTVKKDATYTCTFTAGTAKGTVAIVVQNDSGQYVVQGPKG